MQKVFKFMFQMVNWMDSEIMKYAFFTSYNKQLRMFLIASACSLHYHSLTSQVDLRKCGLARILCWFYLLTVHV